MVRPYLQPEDHADVFRAIAHRWRRVIVDHLLDQQLSFSDLRKRLPISDATLSAHLRILREAGLVKPQRDGRSISYQLNLTQLRTARHWIDKSVRAASAA